VPFTGRSQIVDPRGEVVVRAGRAEQGRMPSTATSRFARRKRLTAITPLFSNRRPEMYRRLTARR
jgi:predicted amidohydrolase